MNKNPVLIYFLLIPVQIVLSQLIQPGPDWVLTLLPVMLLCLPTGWPTLRCMLFAFCTGLAVDFFSGGVLGLSALALTPLGWMRNFFLRKFFNDELVDRGEPLSWRKWGMGIVGLVLLMTAIFLLIYIFVDAGGERSFWMGGRTFLLSMAADAVLALLILPAVLER